MTTRLTTLGLLTTLLLVPFSVRAEDDKGEDRKPQDAEAAINFAGSLGLAGMQRMVDARTPSGMFHLRGGVRYTVDVARRTIKSTTDVDVQLEHHQLGVYAGGSVLGMIDAGILVPYEWTRVQADVDGGSDLDEESTRAWGNMDAAAKFSFSLGPIELAPYAIGKLPTAESHVDDLLELEWGMAGTFSILNEHLSVHGNVAGFNREEGLAAIRYRVGAAFVVWADHNAVVRLYGYMDGIEYEGDANSDVNLDAGIQASLLEFITVELSVRVRIVDGGFLDENLDEQLADRGLNNYNIDDEGTWGIQLALGFTF